MSDQESNKAKDLANWVIEKAVDGIRPLSSAQVLAEEYQIDQSCADNSARIDSLIKWEISKNFTSGFITGLGGVLTMPVSLPVAFGASWVI